MKVLLIGAGNMGLTYARGMSASTILGGKKIMILEKSPEKIKLLKKEPDFKIFDNIKDCLPDAEIIFIAVKPYHASDLFASIKPYVNPNQVFVSVMAGVTIKSIQNGLGIKKVVRAMPNLPAMVNKGMTAYTSSKEVSDTVLLNIQTLLDTTGKSLKVKNEEFIDASTGISGSGPAYVFYFMESMMNAAIKMGFSEKESRMLVSQTFEGAVEIFNQSDISPEEWMNRVASKGGTTEAALNSMNQNKVKKYIEEAAFAAFHRAVELGKEK
ncbi:pyrroline-5-carboxylate reductase [Abyssalbus ytuae]|uniref:Pyrroline-5-carboxylate reductase n=1 Tax=Abyssalbus ytuae TaxID=2926907 RepID=A0A9E6ZLN2_9FLAO|nr:pyrroline-5-carboxylate reductase [Abyssalbus ytuae]UOB16550.1 pyrroline-5-carboxylate reductase [Abyssalbus ytuae]